MMQGEPLSMISYDIGILQLIKKIRRDLPDAPHTRYTDCAIALVTLTRIETYFNLLTCQGPGRGYYPGPSKSVLIMYLENLESRKLFVARHGFKVCTGTHYLGGYIGDNESKHDWLRERMLM